MVSLHSCLKSDEGQNGRTTDEVVCFGSCSLYSPHFYLSIILLELDFCFISPMNFAYELFCFFFVNFSLDFGLLGVCLLVVDPLRLWPCLLFFSSAHKDVPRNPPGRLPFSNFPVFKCFFKKTFHICWIDFSLAWSPVDKKLHLILNGNSHLSIISEPHASSSVTEITLQHHTTAQETFIGKCPISTHAVWTHCNKM